jgi:mono/diheme cytochrome c family protein
MRSLSTSQIWVAILWMGCVAASHAYGAENAIGVEFFEKRIRPILVDHCYKCHSLGEKIKGELRLDSKQGLLAGGKTRPSIVPGEPEKSLLIEAVRYTNEDLQMPPKEQLSKEQVADLVAWVKLGAPDPRTEAPVKSVGSDIAAARQRWPFTPIVAPAIPAVKNAAWAKTPIDRFILSRLVGKGLAPAQPADRRTLIRRATFDLTGLPPSPAEVEVFVNDPSPDAFAKVVDRLLASPAYGQRYARYWLDLVRYTDSFDARGTGGPKDCADAWRYRDYVVQAFNQDLPYDQFVMQQIAGDLLAANGPENAGEKNGTGALISSQNAASRTQHSAFSTLNPLIATTVYAIGNWGGGDADKEKLITDIADDQVDLTGRAFLGLTVACARCHDHKFDPIPTEDYYGLAGFFFSSHILPGVGPKTDGPDMLRIPLVSKEEAARRETIKSQLAELEQKGGEYRRESFKPMRASVRDISGIAGLHALKAPGKPDTPSATFNTSSKAVSFSTIKMPARSVAIHPPPAGGVAAVFESPISGTMEIAATLSDGDASCGDGIEYRLIHRTGETAKLLASGAMDNGKSKSLDPQSIKLAAGDRIELLVLPRAEYTCDTTLINLHLSPAEGAGKTFDLLTEVLANPFATNTPWHFDQVLPDPRVAALKADLAKPVASVNGLQDGGCPGTPYAGFHDVKVHIRGRYDRLGALVPRHFPKVLAGDQPPTISTGSGRLELARWIASPGNPLTARVMVNRLWQWHFGEALVRTPNNFGKLGTPPTHPELLDYLAGEFVKSNWSMKAMHRSIMLSAAYQQSSSPSADSQRIDPDNLLLSHANRRRLDAEGIRDTFLAVTGELDPSAGGVAVKDLNSTRRTLYLMTIRSDRTGYRMLFDAADPTAIIDRRIDSTVAPQALFLMNHPFVLARAKKLAAEAASPPHADPQQRVQWLHEKLFSRPASAEEIELAQKFIAQHPANGWEQYCHALLCSNELIYVD